MLFNSLEFILFLPPVFYLYWLLRRSVRLQNLFVVVCSYLFYGWWDWRFLLLIAFTTLCSYGSGLLMEKKEAFRKVFCTVNIIVNLGILFLFKYYDFFADSFTALMSGLGLKTHPATLSLLLPVGISFYTLQAIGYTIDVYRRQIPAARDIGAFFAFISFFPQLVAGPIERATRLYPQFLKQRIFDSQLAISGCRLILWGFFKKIVIADGSAQIVNAVFGDIAGYNATALWLTALLFSFQIYGDFSGYSDIAIGTARLFGIRLMKNFDAPYLSKSIPGFWQRWHISLNTWFRDYLYIPLGGNRGSHGKHIRNILIVFLVSGLWHGANWTFIAWGLYHALFFLPRVWLGRSFMESVRFPWLSIGVTFLIVTCGWVIFRADNISEAVIFLQGMLGGNKAAGLMGFPLKLALKYLLAIGLMMAVEYIVTYHRARFSLLRKPTFRVLRWASYLLLSLWILLSYEVEQSFIYFQF